MPQSEQNSIRLRPSQEEILSYTHGKMGISAVPGSGKTWTLSLLAANLLTQGMLDQDQEILIVTLVNSAVNNFYQRVSGFVVSRGLIPNIGYRVRTLHGLANDIVRERPDLVGLEDGFQIIDDNEANDICADVSLAWLNNHPDYLTEYLSDSIEPGKLDWVQRGQLPDLVKDVAGSFIRFAKDLRETPDRLVNQIKLQSQPLPLAIMGCEIYASYQRALAYRGAVDFDDLIRLALLALESDSNLLDRLRYRWPYILEDEAQDSSQLQELILERLASQHGNWVRDGDPNQAIYETFTTANPKYLREFVTRMGVSRRDLPESGRSTLSIIKLANSLVKWTQTEHPLIDARDALQSPPEIKPTLPGDPQPNPGDDPTKIFLIKRKYSPQEEIQAVADSAARWLNTHPQGTHAIPVPRNQRGFEGVDEMKHHNVEVVDSLLRSTSSTRVTAGALGNLLRYLADPGAPTRLATAWKIWRRIRRGSYFARGATGNTGPSRCPPHRARWSWFPPI